MADTNCIEIDVEAFSYPPELDLLSMRISEALATAAEALEVAENTSQQQGPSGYTPVKGVDYFDGNPGADFKYSDFTPEQLAALKGDKGDQANLTVAFNDQADNYALLDTDVNKHIRMSKATASNLTVNDVFASGESCTVEQNGVGQVTFIAGAGVTLKSAEDMVKTRVKYSGVTILKTPTAGEYQLFGDLTA